jgi:hypothetical protein
MSTTRSKLLTLVRDPLWQFAGVVVALVLGALTLALTDSGDGPAADVSGTCNAVGSGNVVDC